MQRLSQIAINDEGFLFDPVTGGSYTVNQTGLFILKALKEGKKAEEIPALLTEEFEVDYETAQRDTVDFVEKLRSYGLV